MSAATTGTMILLTSSSASALFLAAGHSPLDYALAFGLVTTVGAYTGKRCVALLVQRRGRTARGDEASGWQAARNVRPIPRELLGTPEVRYGLRAAGGALLVAVGLLLRDEELRGQVAEIVGQVRRTVVELRESIEDAREQAPVNAFVGAIFSAF